MNSADLTAGIGAPLNGFRYLRDHPRLRKFAIAPILLNMILTFVTTAAIIYYAREIYLQNAGKLADMPLLSTAGDLLLMFVIVLASILSVVVAYMVIALMVCGVLFEKLAFETEREIGHDVSQFEDITIFHLAVDLTRDITKLILLHAAIFLIQCIPGLGPAVGTPASFALQWYVLGVEYLSFPMLLRGLRRDQRLLWARQHLFATMGLGAIVAFFLLIPILNALILTAAVVGAVLLYNDRPFATPAP
jgi:CysZ protein